MEKLIRAVQQRIPFPSLQKLIDAYIEERGRDAFISDYITCIKGKRFQADAHAKVITYLERKGYSFGKHDPFVVIEFDGEFPGDYSQHRFFEVSDSTVIHVASTGNMVASGTTGFFIWEGSVAFLALLLESPSFKGIFTGKKIVELGCGAGLAGISTVCIAGPERALLTDIQLVHDKFAQQNVAYNPQPVLSSQVLSWDDWGQLNVIRNEFDVAIGCDLVYDPEVCDELLPALQYIFEEATLNRVVLMCTLRNPTTFETFISKAKEFCNLSVEGVTISASNPIIVTNPDSLRLVTLEKKNK